MYTKHDTAYIHCLQKRRNTEVFIRSTGQFANQTQKAICIFFRSVTTQLVRTHYIFTKWVYTPNNNYKLSHDNNNIPKICIVSTNMHIFPDFSRISTKQSLHNHMQIFESSYLHLISFKNWNQAIVRLKSYVKKCLLPNVSKITW